MGLWEQLESITHRLEVIHEQESRLKGESTLTKLNRIHTELFCKGIDYTNVCYIQDVARAVDVECNIVRAEFLEGSNLMHIMKIDRILDNLIAKVQQVKSEG